MKIPNIPLKIKEFLKEVRLEMKKVNWPTRQETMKYTLLVVGLSLATAVFLGGLDAVFQYLLNTFIV
jgi:preprotein translocase subunit SecE